MTRRLSRLKNENVGYEVTVINIVGLHKQLMQMHVWKKLLVFPASISVSSTSCQLRYASLGTTHPCLFRQQRQVEAVALSLIPHIIHLPGQPSIAGARALWLRFRKEIFTLRAIF